ncbi:MAG: GAF domain-containing sensor histidine kinase [Candidatus Korobacteraceae bacterium]
MSALLPIKESVRALILDATTALQPHFSEITAAWRKQMFAEFEFEGRAMAALERLNLATGFALFSQSDFGAFFENLNYFGTRLAKLQIDTRAVARSLELYHELCEPHIRNAFADRRAFAERQYAILAALDTLSSAIFVAVSGAYFDTQRNAGNALLEVLDAELSARNLSALLERVLGITTRIFNASTGLILLLDPGTQCLRIKAAVGLEGDLSTLTVEVGQGFSGHIAETGEPDMLPDISQSHGILNPLLRGNSQSLWGAPLKEGDRVIGVLMIGFARPYVWLPTERELLRAIADRSALAINRAEMTDALREREMRIAELSGHLLKVQEEERKHISRELHDETGQALMVIRLYLSMLDKAVTTRTAKAKIQELLEVVDRTIEGIRRIIGRLSPLVLQELGLIAAIRKEAKDLSKSSGINARVAVSDDVGRVAPEVETAIYRVVQESLHNVAKHSNAHVVTIEMHRADNHLRLRIEDDGMGIVNVPNSQRPTFGLAGMRERISTLGGTLRVESRKGKGTKILVSVPVPGNGSPFSQPSTNLRLTSTPGGDLNAEGARPVISTGTNS